MTAEALVAIHGVEKHYASGGITTSVLRGIDLTIERGDFVAIMGPSGSGKSTLLNLVGGLDRPSAGEILFEGSRIDALPESGLARWRARNVGFIFQFYNLMSMLTAAQNVELPLLLTSLPRKVRRTKVDAALSLVNLEDRAKHRPSQLSGGQQQRIAIARALISDPQLLLCDEPTGNLDRESAGDIMGVLESLNRDFAKTIILVTHDPEAARFARRTLRLDKGVFGPPAGAR
jgi:putative ABC transport system ATP-binding protein